MELATNKLMPYGGEQKPIAKFIVNIIPKVTGLIPNEVHIGNKIEDQLIVAGILSTNIPITNNNKINYQQNQEFITG